ncbi:MAG: cold-shock protein [Candidatus Hydrogenedentota bacterium]|nr:MAG: cold-shock protein [Candidatus Hydrogenedentota bacterium]
MSEENGDTKNVGRFEGKVKWFSDPKGYGFIFRDEDADIFVHHSAIKMDGFRTLKEGEAVMYDLMDSPKGFQAANVIPVPLVETESSESSIA